MHFWLGGLVVGNTSVMWGAYSYIYLVDLILREFAHGVVWAKAILFLSFFSFSLARSLHQWSTFGPRRHQRGLTINKEWRHVVSLDLQGRMPVFVDCHCWDVERVVGTHFLFLLHDGGNILLCVVLHWWRHLDNILIFLCLMNWFFILNRVKLL